MFTWGAGAGREGPWLWGPGGWDCGGQRGPHQVHHVLLVGLSQGSRHEGLPLLLLLSGQFCSGQGQGREWEAARGPQAPRHRERPPHPSAAAAAALRWAPSPCSAPGRWPFSSGGPCSLSAGPLRTWVRGTEGGLRLPAPAARPQPTGKEDTHCTRSFSSQDVSTRSTSRPCCSSCGGGPAGLPTGEGGAGARPALCTGVPQPCRQPAHPHRPGTLLRSLRNALRLSRPPQSTRPKSHGAAPS